MILIILSLVMGGYIGISIGSFFGAEAFMYLLGAVGVLSPSLYVLEKLYKEIKDKS